MPDDQQFTATASVHVDGDSSRVMIEAEGSSLGAAAVVNDGRFVQLHFEIPQGHVP